MHRYFIKLVTSLMSVSLRRRCFFLRVFVLFIFMFYPIYKCWWSKEKDQNWKKRKIQRSRLPASKWPMRTFFKRMNEWILAVHRNCSLPQNPFFPFLLSAIFSVIRWPMANWPDDKSVLFLFFSFFFLLRRQILYWGHCWHCPSLKSKQSKCSCSGYK